jgi:hypothetical protein
LADTVEPQGEEASEDAAQDDRGDSERHPATERITA